MVCIRMVGRELLLGPLRAQSLQDPEQDAWTVVPFVNRRWLPVSLEQGVNSRPCRTNRILHSEDHIVGLLAEFEIANARKRGTAASMASCTDG